MGQEIGISPLQLVGMVSTIANDGVWVAPRIVATTAAAQRTPQTVVFQPAGQRRVLSPITAAQMKQMMQGVILHGTGPKAILEGYSSAGKTGTAQKVDPGTHGYSHSNYVASFAGFAPVNNPAITVAVILDSARGLHQGGQISAPVFQRIAQQVLAYLHTPHDVDLPASRQLILASKKVSKESLEESSPDHLGEPVELADNSASQPQALPVRPAKPSAAGDIRPAALISRQAPVSDDGQANPPAPAQPIATKLPSNGTVVLDVEQGGIVVPSFMGKTVRNAIEQAEGTGLELDAVGSGLARDQTPQPGAHVAAGTTVVVHFER
jgi:cell division protein FtsI (penicillin-binding protein 3)